MLACSRSSELSLLPEAFRRMSARRLSYVAALAQSRSIEKRLRRIDQPTKRDGLSIPQVPATNESDCTLAS
jgi:hypothetical protein